MGIEFHLLLDPAEVERDRLLGVKRKSPKLIDFLGLKKKKRFPRRYSKGNNKGPDRAASEGSDGPWKLHKDLFSTDVGANWGHLLLPKADVEAHILNAEMLTKFNLVRK
ncbi:hypothetical protein SAY86_000313 [Trapa natans]|uniref:Uncharacterized protein n=1 Tax=Trapa natans TaxID=22666 RepID=A0AAN7MA03_TRANT|nr:hypothetical protein SAY86_000313 [Trapa natans]